MINLHIMYMKLYLVLIKIFFLSCLNFQGGESDTYTKFSPSQLGEPVAKIYAKPGSLNSMLCRIIIRKKTGFTIN